MSPFGRNTTDGSHVYFKEPTPEKINDTAYCTGIKDAKITFSHEGGKTEALNLNLTTIDANDIIRYTTDASLPNEQSKIYNNPIPINQTTVIRASIFQKKISFLPLARVELI